MTAVVRTFIALDIPDEVRETIRLIQRELAKCPGISVAWTRLEGIHLTLKFLGDVESSRLEEVSEVVRTAGSQFDSLRLNSTQIGAFPKLSRPKVLNLGVDGGEALLILRDEIELQLDRIGFQLEEKSFHPHLTVGRVKSFDFDSDLPLKIRDLVLPDHVWQADSIRVMSSVLKPSGAEYGIINIVPLGGN